MTMIKNLFAATLLVASFGANATTYDMGDVTNTNFGYSQDGYGAFDDTYNFTFSAAQNVEAVLFNFSFSTDDNVIGDFVATLSYNGTEVYTTNVTNNVEVGSYMAAPAGNYSLDLSGDYGSYGTYDWDVTVSAVPEPSVLGLMFGGLGLVGMIAYRARKA